MIWANGSQGNHACVKTIGQIRFYNRCKQRFRRNGAELRRTEFNFSGEPVSHVVKSISEKIEFCTSELDLRVGSRFLGRDLDPPTAYNSLTSESQRCRSDLCCSSWRLYNLGLRNVGGVWTDG